jgi:Zn-finger nucleic acid-binding protein
MTIMNHFCVRCGDIWLKKGATNKASEHAILCKKCLMVLYQEASR